MRDKLGVVPMTFIEEKVFVGFGGNTDEKMEESIESGLQGESKGGKGLPGEKNSEVPLLGEIDPSEFSLPALAVILGALDGFNVCSLGALALILSLVITLRSRRKILIFGGFFFSLLQLFTEFWLCYGHSFSPCFLLI